ncbi:hypothetical protein DOY81_008819 [Sarcophaga bullata]|nr:hypothetical protein DOY81_008819 [Sarcophaga bullata]
MGSKKLFQCKIATVIMVALQVLLLLLNFVDYAYSDYENTWNLYYEQPCCMGGISQHHIRHHKDRVKDFSCGPLHYKTFYFDENN